MPLPVLDIQVCGEEEGEDGEEGGHPEESQERTGDRVQRLMDNDGMSVWRKVPDGQALPEITLPSCSCCILTLCSLSAPGRGSCTRTPGRG